MKNRYIIFALMATVGLVSCEDFFDSVTDVDIEPHESRLAVFAYFDHEYDGKLIHVGNSKGFTDGDSPDFINDASLSLSRNGVPLNLTQTLAGDGKYYMNSPIDAEVGDEFRLDVVVDGYDPVYATAKILPEIIINDIDYKGETFSVEYGEPLPEYEVVIADDAAIENYYAVEVFRLDTINGYRDHRYLTSNDPVMQEWVNVGLVFDDKAFNGDEFRAQVLLEEYLDIEDGVIYEFNVKSISEEMYRYAKSYTDYYYSFDNPFAEPVTVTSNMEEEGYGIFTFIRNERFEVEPQ